MHKNKGQSRKQLCPLLSLHYEIKKSYLSVSFGNGGTSIVLDKVKPLL